MIPIATSHHRNGVSGEPFSTGIFKSNPDGRGNRMFFFVQFDSDKSRTAVFDFKLLVDGIIEFGKNSWRGDSFSEEIKNWNIFEMCEKCKNKEPFMPMCDECLKRWAKQ